MIARIHDDGEPKIGSMISLIGLSIRFGKPIEWVRRQVLVNHMGETWEADFYNGGRRRGYKLISRLPASMCIERTVQQDHAATMRKAMAKAKHKDFSTMSDDELRSFCQALDAVARKAEAKMLNRRTSSFPSTERSEAIPPQEKHDG